MRTVHRRNSPAMNSGAKGWLGGPGMGRDALGVLEDGFDPQSVKHKQMTAAVTMLNINPFNHWINVSMWAAYSVSEKEQGRTPVPEG